MLRHCTMTELVDLRDGEGTWAARSHVDACDACRRELERLYQRRAALRALPSLTPPRDRWETIRAGHLAERRRHTAWRAAAGGLAVAAIVAAVVGLRALPSTGASPADAEPRIEDLVAQSRQLEDVLQGLQQQPRVMSGYTATLMAELEDRIAAIDLGISDAGGDAPREQLWTLWQERVALMDMLVETHVRPVAYVGY